MVYYKVGILKVPYFVTFYGRDIKNWVKKAYDEHKHSDFVTSKNRYKVFP